MGKTSAVESLRILHVCDAGESCKNIHGLLEQAIPKDIIIDHVTNVADVVRVLEDSVVDVVIFDINMHDSDGITTLSNVVDHAGFVPIIAVTVSNDPEVGVKALRAGAYDYLDEDEMTASSLARSIRYVVERRHLLTAVKNATERSAEEGSQDEINALNLVSRPTWSQVTERMFGIVSLRKTIPGEFDKLARRYRSVIENALEQQAFKVDNKISDDLREIAEFLGQHRAVPRDVLDLHIETLNLVKNDVPNLQKLKHYTHEGRLLLIELMGLLVVYYRNYSFGMLHSTE